jgi:predicted nucleic acid-binding Zn ribbon protein
MERAARFIRKNKFSQEILTDEQLARAVWPAAVGKAIARHTSRLKLVRGTLVVEVEDAIWQKQLYPLTGQILDRLQKVMGSELVEDLEFRVAIPRRQIMRAATLDQQMDTGERNFDEADTIQDPVLKKVYRLSRKKATA